MTQLIANIGNSDLGVKFGAHYLCPGFDRKEPNFKQQEEALAPPYREIWDSRKEILATELYQPLTGKSSSSFYELTQKLYEAYCADFDTWHKRFSFGRILGVIDRAIALGATEATFFVTQQEPLQDNDTFYLFQILKRWLEKERPNFTIHQCVLPLEISAVDADALFDFYYGFFQELQTANENRSLRGNEPQKGEIWAGQVIRHQRDGALVKLNNGWRGVLPIKQVSQQSISSETLKEIFPLGKNIKVLVSRCENGRLELATKQWEQQAGQIVRDPQSVFASVVAQSSVNQGSVTTSENQDLWLVSCKGGTPQMKTALQLQAMAVANTGGVIFIDPITNLQSMLVGEPSECRQTSYWRYLRSQQYETVKQLLTRWDFDGALQVLMTWQNYLKKLAENDLSDRDDIATSARNLNRMINLLEIGKACRNFDMRTALGLAQQNEALVRTTDLSIKTMLKPKEYRTYRVLHLLAHCRIHKELNEAANLLTVLASFYEIALDLMIEKLLIKAELDEENIRDYRSNINSEAVGRLLNGKFMQRFRERLKTGEPLPLINNRYNRRKFIDALIYHLDDRDRKVWESTEEQLKLLDEWCDMRNNIIHRAEGINLEQAYQQISKRENTLSHPSKIIPKLEFICQNPLLGLSNECRNLYTTDGGEYYIYSFLRNEIIQALMDDAL